jgi:hypothetical protein
MYHKVDIIIISSKCNLFFRHDIAEHLSLWVKQQSLTHLFYLDFCFLSQLNLLTDTELKMYILKKNQKLMINGFTNNSKPNNQLSPQIIEQTKKTPQHMTVEICLLSYLLFCILKLFWQYGGVCFSLVLLQHK